MSPEDELAALRTELSRMRQRSEETLAVAILVGLDRWTPDERVEVFVRVSEHILERLSIMQHMVDIDTPES